MEAAIGRQTGNLPAITRVLTGAGVYVAHEAKRWNEERRAHMFQQIRTWGFDFVCPRVGGYGAQWYRSDTELRDWRDQARQAGLQFVPFIDSTPTHHQRDAETCAALAAACGIVAVAMEDDYAEAPAAMLDFGLVYRAGSPHLPIIVTGYGDPITRFGLEAWPYGQMTAWADAYSPQWYYGDWAIYRQHGVAAAIDWAARQCAQVLGESFPLCPSLSIYTCPKTGALLPPTAINTGHNCARRWHAPIFWWEYASMNSIIAAACLA